MKSSLIFQEKYRFAFDSVALAPWTLLLTGEF